MTARALIARHDRTATIAAFNGPRSLTIAGSRLSLEAMAAELELDGIFARFVQVDHPFHHPLMQPASEALEEALEDLDAAGGNGPFFQYRHRSTGAAVLDATPLTGGEECGNRCYLPRAVNALMDEGHRCLAGNQCPTRAGSFDSGMPGRANRQGSR